jgi:3-oxoacyl-[acyl-carrier protein] reductase
MPERPLEGQVAVVTGAAKRIGRSIALRLAADGAAVAVNYATSKADAEAVARQIIAKRGQAIAMQADVTRRTEVKKLMAGAQREFGRIDILVNNAGVFFPAKFDELNEEQWDRVMNVNLKSQYLCAQEAASAMKKQGRGRIVNLASLGGLLAWPAYTHYCVSKAGVIMLTRCLARALAPEILVNSVAPGTIEFPGDDVGQAEHLRDYVERVPLHRTGRGEDIAEAVAYLVKSDFVTGQTIVVDGGRMLI